VVKDRQVRRLWGLLTRCRPMRVASASSGMCERTGRRYRDLGKLPSEVAPEHRWRTRADPFAEVWGAVHEQLEASPGLQAKTLFEWLQRQHPGRFQDGQIRSFQRGVKAWRATCGPAKEVFFGQVHHPGRLCASDFTHMTSLNVTITGQVFEHLIYHFVLTYSNWESATICFSESFESLSDGLQNALWELGGVPARHRSDRMSAAVNNLSDRTEFTARYKSLLDHYGLGREMINARQAHENGDVEQSHRRFKEAVDQELMLRGSREFAHREEYACFLRDLIARRNAGRQKRLVEEIPLFHALPRVRHDGVQRLRVRVDSGSLIKVKRNVYSVNSRLIGEWVDVCVKADHLEVWYGQKEVDRLPRLVGSKKHRINYRHVIDWLVRKPGAFGDYRYREDLFPTSRFRMAYDALQESMASRAAQQYVQILHLAAHESESAVDEALRVLLEEERPVTFEAVEEFVRRGPAAPATTDVFVEMTELVLFDGLFSHKEVWNGFEHGCEDDADRLFAGVAPADVSRELRGLGPAGAAGNAVLRAIPLGPVEPGMRDASGQPGGTPAARLEAPLGQDAGELRSQASAGESVAASANPVGRLVPGPS
jgi:hypothetical protein